MATPGLVQLGFHLMEATVKGSSGEVSGLCVLWYQSCYHGNVTISHLRSKVFQRIHLPCTQGDI